MTYRATSSARKDSNQAQIVAGLRARGISVHIMHSLCDILVGVRGRTYAFEIKDPSKPPSKRKLTPKEQKIHDTWRGHLQVVTSIEEILRVIYE